MKKILISNIVLVLLFFVYNGFAQNAKPFTIPTLTEWKGDNGHLKLSKHLSVAGNVSEKFLTVFKNDLLAFDAGFKVKTRLWVQHKWASIIIDIDKSLGLPEEAYKISINDQVRITASAEKGAFWGTRTLLQLLERSSELGLPKGEAYDYPQYPLRGFVLDDGRKFFDIQFLRDYVKMLSYYKINDFQIHLNDNGFKKFFNDDWDNTYGAFRLESSSYPSLTAKDGNYSKAEFIALQKLANDYHVKIVPEIDVPAHALAFSKAVPEIGSKKYGMDHLDLDNPRTYRVVDSVFKEYLERPNPVFIGDEIHIGTDEYAKPEAEKFRAFTDHYIKLIQSYGKTPRLWGALTHAEGKTPVTVKGVNMNVWYNGYADPKKMMDLGYDIISTPDGWLYIVPAAGYYFDYLNNKKIYEQWTPAVVGNQTFDEHHPQIKGGSFAVWNDHVGNGITQKDVHDRVFHSIGVLAQKMWGGKTTSMPYEDFAKGAKQIGEAPGVNVAARVNSKDSLVLWLNATLKDKSKNKHAVSGDIDLGKDEFGKYLSLNEHATIQTDLTSIGYNYTVSFSIKPREKPSADAILFSSKDAVVKANQGNTGKLGFSREGYNYNFDYVLTANQWTNITIAGDNKGTSLYVNGAFKERLEGRKQTFTNAKDTIAQIQTLVFPLQNIGASKNGFKGALKNIRVYNRLIGPQTIKTLASQ